MECAKNVGYDEKVILSVYGQLEGAKVVAYNIILVQS